MTIALNILALGIMIGSCLALIRTMIVGNYRRRLIGMVYNANKADIDNGCYSSWRWDIYNEVSFDKMLWTFWKRMRSFYPDKSFIDPNAVDPYEEHIDPITNEITQPSQRPRSSAGTRIMW